MIRRTPAAALDEADGTAAPRGQSVAPFPAVAGPVRVARAEAVDRPVPQQADPPATHRVAPPEALPEPRAPGGEVSADRRVRRPETPPGAGATSKVILCAAREIGRRAISSATTCRQTACTSL